MNKLAIVIYFQWEAGNPEETFLQKDKLLNSFLPGKKSLTITSSVFISVPYQQCYLSPTGSGQRNSIVDDPVPPYLLATHMPSSSSTTSCRRPSVKADTIQTLPCTKYIWDFPILIVMGII